MSNSGVGRATCPLFWVARSYESVVSVDRISFRPAGSSTSPCHNHRLEQFVQLSVAVEIVQSIQKASEWERRALGCCARGDYMCLWRASTCRVAWPSFTAAYAYSRIIVVQLHRFSCNLRLSSRIVYCRVGQKVTLFEYLSSLVKRINQICNFFSFAHVSFSLNDIFRSVWKRET